MYEIENARSFATVEQSMQESDVDDPATDELTDASCSTKDTAVYSWNKKETLLLLQLYKENEDMFTSGKTRQNKCWELISQKISERGYNISGKKCATKFQCLKRTYKHIKDENNTSGNSRKSWEYFDLMDEIFYKKPWMEPLSVAGSHIEMKENEQPLPSSSKMKGKRNIYRAEVLEYRKNRDLKRDEQHAEKMELLRDVQNFLQITLQEKTVQNKKT